MVFEELRRMQHFDIRLEPFSTIPSSQAGGLCGGSIWIGYLAATPWLLSCEVFFNIVLLVAMPFLFTACSSVPSPEAAQHPACLVGQAARPISAISACV